VVTQEQKKLKGIKGMNKGGKHKQLAFWHSKFLEYGLTQNGVESVHHIHLMQHPINMDT
jgi:hypothetical protein